MNMQTLEIFGGALLVWVVLAIIGAWAGEGSWWHRFALATDVFFAAILLNRRDVTISSWAGISTSPVAKDLKVVLDEIQTNHVEIARQSDIQADEASEEYLKTKDGTVKG